MKDFFIGISDRKLLKDVTNIVRKHNDHSDSKWFESRGEKLSTVIIKNPHTGFYWIHLFQTTGWMRTLEWMEDKFPDMNEKLFVLDVWPWKNWEWREWESV